MIIYEKHNFGKEDSFVIFESINMQFDIHLHRCLEFIYIQEGEAIITIDQKPKTLKKGFAALILPNQLHSYKTDDYSKITICIFSPELVGSFMKLLESKTPINNVFEIKAYNCLPVFNENNIFEIKAYLYKICGLFTDNIIFIDKKNKKDSNSLLLDMILYIDDNYKSTCSLKELSKKIGYDYAYLSKFFIKHVGFSFVEYLNQYRINYACYLLKNTDDTITEISQACGFNTIRSFNRNFVKIIKTTPRNYKIN